MPTDRPAAKLFPIFGSLRGYRRSWLRGDLVAGLTVWAVLVPEALAYASIAGVSPVVGLYAGPLALAAGLLRLGFGQVPKPLGVGRGDGDFFRQLWTVLSHLGHVRWLTLVVGLGSLAVVVSLRRFAPSCLPRWWHARGGHGRPRRERGRADIGAAIGGALPIAVGIALNPIPIIVVVLMLTSRRAKVNGPAFVLGWLVGLGLVGVIVLAIAGPANASTDGAPATWVGVVEIALGVLAARRFRGRPHGGEQPAMPKWLGTIDRTTPIAALGLAGALSGANPKNLLLAVAGGAAIAQTGIPGGQEAIAYLVFALIGTLGVGVPVVLYFVLGERSVALLGGLKDWMTEHNAVIMSVLCLVIAMKLIGDGIGGLTA